MITLVKDRQFLTVIKTVKNKKEEKCIGVFDFEKKEWAENAVFSKAEMKGQKYNEPLRCLANLNRNSSYYDRLVEWVEFLLSINKVPYDNIGYDFFNDDIKRKVLNNERNFKLAKKYLSKNMTEQTTVNDILCNSNSMYIDLKSLFEKGWIDEVIGYQKMNHSAIYGNEFTDTYEELFDSYKYTIEHLYSKGLTEKEITAYYRIMYFQGCSMFVGSNTVIQYLEALKLLKQSIPTGNFIMNYRKVMSEYNDYINKEAEKIFAENQNVFDLHYTHNNISVLVPQTRKELAYYGNVFHNCLNGYEWENYLKTGKRKVVIILKDNEPQVCCDMDNFLNIRQYYAPYNHCVKDEELKEFRTLYENHLASVRIK